MAKTGGALVKAAVKAPARKPTKSGPGLRPMYDRLQEHGIERVCLDLSQGASLTSIAKSLDVSMSALINWYEADEDRSARVLLARSRSARVWDEKAEEELRMAADPFELAKAREIAQHYRWRAKVVAPREYGDKVTQEMTGANGGPIQLAAVNLKNLSESELKVMEQLMAKAAGGGT